MDLKGRLVSKGENYYILDKIDDYGVIHAKSAIGAVSSSSKRYSIDPFESKVMLYDERYCGYEEFSDEEMKSLLELDKRVSLREVDRVVGYKNERQDYLLVFYMNTGRIHILFLTFPEVYGLVINKGKLDMDRNEFDFSCSISDIGKRFPDVRWLENAKVFKYINGETNPCVLETIGRMLHDFSVNSKVLLPILQNYNYGEGSRYAMKIKGKSGNMLVNPYALNWDFPKLKIKGTRVSRKFLAEYLESSYNHPCAYFNDEELEKVLEILKINGYEEIVEDVRMGNGKRSNFKVESTGERVCIMDANKGPLYSLHKLVIAPVKSAIGIPLYYEIRMYPLCGNASYRVLFSSCLLESCNKIIEYPYANLIRGNLLEVRDYFFSITRVIDTNVDITIRYTYHGARGKVFSATYMKGSGEWKYIEKSTTGYDEKFLSKLLDIFDSVAKVKKIVSERYVVYYKDDNGFILDDVHNVGVTTSFANCRNIIMGSDKENFLIVKYIIKEDEDVKENTWVYSKSQRNLSNVELYRKIC